jgi:hypothetical protein
MKISKGRTYTTIDGRAVRIYATDGCGGHRVHGAIKFKRGWHNDTWTQKGLNIDDLNACDDDLIEALKPNGIPVDLPDPPEVDCNTWEIVPKGGIINADDRYNVLPVNIGNWTYSLSQIGCMGRSWTNEIDDQIFIRYIPNTAVEMTLAEVCKALGKTIKIVK